MTHPKKSGSRLHLGIAAFGTDGARSGIGSYLRQWLQALSGADPAIRVDILAPGSEMSELVPDSLDCDRRSLPERLCAPGSNMGWHQLGLPWAAHRRAWDVAFLPAANRRLPAWMPCPTVGTVHDMSMARVKGKYDRTHSLYFHTVLPGLIRRLTRVITISACSKRDIVELAQKRDGASLLKVGIGAAGLLPGGGVAMRLVGAVVDGG
ncbi:MAG: hypothetical protein KBH14_08470, partial [Vicinamibacteria bacterium]|nr:hypothetical protein [Vicinamibacteria bacterium]